MAEAIKVLGQSAPAATTLTPLYTVPAATSATGNMMICNRGAVDATFRVSVAIAGAGDSNEQYIYFDEPIAANRSFEHTVGMALAATDVVRVYASTADLSFNISGR